MKLSKAQERALGKLSTSEWRSAYDLQESRRTLNALVGLKLAEVHNDFGHFMLPRIMIKYRKIVSPSTDVAREEKKALDFAKHYGQELGKGVTPFPKDPKEREKLEYELALQEGEKRFGSECKHEKTKNGRCLRCFRKVIR